MGNGVGQALPVVPVEGPVSVRTGAWRSTTQDVVSVVVLPALSDTLAVQMPAV